MALKLQIIQVTNRNLQSKFIHDLKKFEGVGRKKLNDVHPARYIWKFKIVFRKNIDLCRKYSSMSSIISFYRFRPWKSSTVQICILSKDLSCWMIILKLYYIYIHIKLLLTANWEACEFAYAAGEGNPEPWTPPLNMSTP